MNLTAYKVTEHFGITIWMSKLVKHTLHFLKNLAFAVAASACGVVFLLFAAVYIVPATISAIKLIGMALGLLGEMRINELFD